MEGVVSESTEWLVSKCSDIDDKFGDPAVLPRVGNQYQAEIPPLMLENDCLLLVRKPPDTTVMVDVPNYFSVGLPIPIMWAHNEVRNIKDNALEVFASRDTPAYINGPFEAENSEESQITSNNEDLELQFRSLGTASADGERVGGLLNFQHVVADGRMDVDKVLPQEKKIELDHENNGYHLVPGALGKEWRDIEYDGFLLGLYIFGKNLLLVKRFVEGQEMGDVLSCYYGKFYRSSEYYRWSEGRKMRSKRCIHGQKIVTGWRKQELLSRLFYHVLEECQNTLMEVSRTFGEGKLTFEEFVFSVKDMVGIKNLIEAVAIGKGQQDLTGTALEPIKTNHPYPVLPEIPIGKACSSLTLEEIINFLTGDFRLSKARSSDLFWEAVWPRLLARGWHSEQPKNHGCAGLKRSLVFLVPDVKKFSRRRLMKGKHYFDSVADVLNKVASETALLELESETANVGIHRKGYMVNLNIKQDPHVLPNIHGPRYIQPCNSNCYNELMKFTIVDTSLFCREKQTKVTQLRSLAADPQIASTPSGLSSETEQDTSAECHDKAEENITSNPAENVAENGAFSDSPECVTSCNTYFPSVPDPMIIAVGNCDNQSTSVSNDRQSRMIMKFQSSLKVKSRQCNSLVPITKEHKESSRDVNDICRDTKQNGEGTCDQSNSPDTRENVDLLVGIFQKPSSPSSLAENPEGHSKGILIGNYNGAEPYHEPPHSHNLVDLNFLHAAADSIIGEPSIMTMVHHDNDSSANKLSVIPETSQQHESSNPSNDGSIIEQRPVMNERRQSTRNRPLTTRALEALALGFFDKKTRRKGVEAMFQNNSMSKSSRRVRRKTVKASLNDGIGNDTACCKMDEGVNGGFTGDTNMVGESQT